MAGRPPPEGRGNRPHHGNLTDESVNCQGSAILSNMADPERPPWWPRFIAVERAVGRRLEGATRSDEFADALTRAAKLARGLRTAYLSATADALHRANLPAWSDMRDLAEQVTGLERRLADLTLELERDRPKRRVRPRSSRRRPQSSAP